MGEAVGKSRNLGKAWLQVSLSFRGSAKTARQELDEVAKQASKAGDKAAKAAVDGYAARFSNVTRKVTSELGGQMKRTIKAVEAPIARLGSSMSKSISKSLSSGASKFSSSLDPRIMEIGKSLQKNVSGALSKGIKGLSTRSSRLKEVGQSFGSSIVNAYNRGITKIASGASKLNKKLFGRIKFSDESNAFFEKAGKFFTSIPSKISSSLGKGLTSVTSGLSKSLGNFMKRPMADLKEMIPISGKIGSALKSSFSKVGSFASSIGSRFSMSISNGLRNSMSYLTSGMTGAAKSFGRNTLYGVRNIGSSLWNSVSKIGSSLGSSLTGAFRSGINYLSSGISRIASELTSKITSAMKLAAAAATAATATVVAKGFQRATTIENAQKTFEAIGYSANEAAKYVETARQSVLGTIYATNDAANAATNALASGITPSGLRNYLDTIANVAGTFHVAYNDIAYLMATTQAAGKVNTRDLWQFADRGVPVIGEMSKALGVTRQEFLDMTEAGKISSKMLQDFLSSRYAGGAAKAAETTTGALSNMTIGIARLGEMLIKGGLPYLRKFAMEMKDAADIIIDANSGAINDLWARSGPKLNAFLDGLGQRVANLAVKMVPKLISGFKTFIAVAKTGLNIIAGPVALLNTLVRSAINLFLSTGGKIASTLKNIADGFTSLIYGIIGDGGEYAVSVVNKILGVLDTFGAWLKSNGRAIGNDVRGILSSFLDAVSGIVKGFVSSLGIANVSIGALFMGGLGIVAKAVSVLNQNSDAIGGILGNIANKAASFATAFASGFSDANGIKSASDLVSTLYGYANELFDLMIKYAPKAGSVFGSVLSGISAYIGPVLDIVGGLASGIGQVLSGFAGNAGDGIANVVNGIVGALVSLSDWLSGNGSSLGSKLYEIVSTALTALSTLLSGFSNGLGLVGTDAGSAVMGIVDTVSALVTKVASGAEYVGNVLGGLVNSVITFATGFSSAFSGASSSGGFSTMIQGIVSSVQGLFSYLAASAPSIGAAFAPMVSTFLTGMKSVIDYIRVIAPYVIDIVKNMAGGITIAMNSVPWDIFANGFKTILTLVSAIPGGAWIAVGSIVAISEGFVKVSQAIALIKNLQIVGMLSNLAKSAKVAAAAQWLLNIAMDANPIGLIIAAVVALIGVFALLWKTSPKFRDFIYGIRDTFVSVFKFVGNFFKGFINGIISVLNFWIKSYLTVLNFVVGGVGKLLGKNWKIDSSAIQIPKLADGGTVSRPTLALIGEGKAWNGGYRQESVVDTKTLNALMKKAASGSSGEGIYAPITVNETSDASKTARTVRRELFNASRRRALG